MTGPWLLRRLRRESRRVRAPLLALAAALAAISFAGGAALLGARAAVSLHPFLHPDVHVIAYVRHDMSPERIDALGALLLRIPGVEKVRQVGSEEALRRLRAAAEPLGSAASALGRIEEGFLPRSLEISLAASATRNIRGADLSRRLRQIDGIAEVDALAEGVERAQSWMAVVRWLAWLSLGLAGLAGILALALAATRLRARRRQEAAVLALLGETPWGTRSPGGLMGAVSGLAGATASVALIELASGGIWSAVRDVFGVLQWPIRPSFSAIEIAFMLLGATVVGCGVGHFATPMPRLDDA